MTRSHIWSIYCLSSSITAHWMAEDAVSCVMFLLALGHAIDGFFPRRMV